MSDEPSAAAAAKPSAVEVAKTASDYLRGDIAKEPAQGGQLGRAGSWAEVHAAGSERLGRTLAD